MLLRPHTYQPVRREARRVQGRLGTARPSPGRRRHTREGIRCTGILPGDAAAPHAEALGWPHDAGKYDPDFRVTYNGLARRLSAMGMEETEGFVTVKINRGACPTWFSLANLKVIGRPAVRVEDL